MRISLLLLAVAGALAGGVSCTHAADASDWVRDTHSAVRLLAGSRDSDVVIGGVEIELAPGWKTYWRTPGDSGVPPRFDFSRSDNVETITTLYPAPSTFADGAGGTSFGYLGRVIFPLRIVPKDASRPVLLRAELNYAVCQKLCLPVEANAEVAMANGASAQDGALAAALNAVPKAAQIGSGVLLDLNSVVRDGNRVLAEVTVAGQNAQPVNLFAEGPTPDWALPVPRLLDQPRPGLLRFAFDLDGLPSGATGDGARLKLTLVGAEAAYEYTVTLN